MKRFAILVLLCASGAVAAVPVRAQWTGPAVQQSSQFAVGNWQSASADPSYPPAFLPTASITSVRLPRVAIFGVRPIYGFGNEFSLPAAATSWDRQGLVRSLPVVVPSAQSLPNWEFPVSRNSVARLTDATSTPDSISAWEFSPSWADTASRIAEPYEPLSELLANLRFAQADTSESSSSEDDSEETDVKKRSEPIGEAPPPDVNELFLRNSILLDPGAMQIDIGFTYTWQEANAIRVLPPTLIALERIRSRRLLVPFSIRYGWKKKLEIFGVLPLGLAQFERDNPLNESVEISGGIGDISGGFVYQVLNSKGHIPDLTFSFTGTIPTASNPFPSPNGNVATLGNGFWSFDVGLNAVKSFDPVVFFGGIGYRYQIQRQFFGIDVQPGEAFNYNFGVGFAVNEDITFAAQLFSSTQRATRFNGRSLPNSDNEPMILRFSVIRRTSETTRVQPFLAIGLNDDSTDASFGIFFTRDIKSCQTCGKKKDAEAKESK